MCVFVVSEASLKTIISNVVFLVQYLSFFCKNERSYMLTVY